MFIKLSGSFSLSICPTFKSGIIETNLFCLVDIRICKSFPLVCKFHYSNMNEQSIDSSVDCMSRVIVDLLNNCYDGYDSYDAI